MLNEPSLLVFGCEWLYLLELYAPNQPFQITQLGAGYNSGSTARTQGLFANVDWNFTDKLQLNAGIRGNWDESYGRGNVQLTIPCSPTVGSGCPFPGVPPGTWATFPVTIPNANNFKDRSPTGKIGLNYTPVPGQFLYAFFARGYKPGGAQAGLPNFNPEHVNDWELGWKSHLLQDHVQLQLGAFYMKYQDMQFSVFNPTNPAAPAVTNIGASKIDGLEFSSQARFGGFNTRIDVAYLHSVLGNITQIASYRLPPNAVVPQCRPGQTAGCFDYAPYETSLNGQSNPYSPKLTASIDVDYRIPIGQDSLGPRLSYSYTGRQYAALFQTDNYFLMPAHGLWDASLAYEADKWLVQSYVNNFTNKLYYAGIGYITGGTGGSTVFYGAPRQYGLRVSRSF